MTTDATSGVLNTIASVTATPGDVLAYRTQWNDFVMGTIRGVNAIADSLHNVAQAPPDGFDAATLNALGDSEAQWATSALSEWNQFAGLADSDVLLQAHVILPAYWQTVQNCLDKQNAEKNPPPGQIDLATGVTWPDLPSYDVQQQLIARLEGLGLVAKGAVQIVGQSAALGAQAVGGAAANALGTVLSSTLGAVPWQVWVGLGVAGGAVLLLGLAVAKPAARVAFPELSLLRRREGESA